MERTVSIRLAADSHFTYFTNSKSPGFRDSSNQPALLRARLTLLYPSVLIYLVAGVDDDQLTLDDAIEDLRDQVRELEVPPEFEPPDEMDVLHRIGELLTVRCPEGWEAAEANLAAPITHRRRHDRER